MPLQGTAFDPVHHLRPPPGVIWHGLLTAKYRWCSIGLLFVSLAILGACSSTSALLCYALAVLTTVACLILATVTIAARCSCNASATFAVPYHQYQYHQRYQQLAPSYAPFHRSRREYKDTNHRAPLSPPADNNAHGTTIVRRPTFLEDTNKYLVSNNQQQTLTGRQENSTKASPVFVLHRKEDKRTQVIQNNNNNNNSVFSSEETAVVIVSSDGDGTARPVVKTWTYTPSSIEKNAEEVRTESVDQSMRTDSNNHDSYISRERSIILVLSVATLVLFLTLGTVGFVTCILNRRQQQHQQHSNLDITSPSQYYQQQFECQFPSALVPAAQGTGIRASRVLTDGGDVKGGAVAIAVGAGVVAQVTTAHNWTYTRSCSTTAVPNAQATNAVPQMLSVVSAGATAGVVVGGVSPTSQATPNAPSATSHHRTMNHQHHHHHHRLRSSNATNTSIVSSSGSSASSSLPIKDPLCAGGTTTAGRHQYGGYHAPVCLDGEVVNLPPSIALPDGEDHPYATRMLHLRNYEQESEIYQKCTRPPPNRTVNDSESPPPYRCSSAGLLSTSSTPSAGNNHPPANSSSTHHHHFGDNNNTVSTTTCHPPAPSQFPVIRCHSLTSSSSSSCSSSTAKRPTLLSNSSSSSSCSSTAADGNTDFLQKTVKILTGSKRVPPTQGQCASGAASAGGSTSANVVGVMVPTNRTAPRRDNNSSGSASGSSSPTNRHSRPPV